MSMLSHLSSLEPEAPAPEPSAAEDTKRALHAPGDIELLARAVFRFGMRPLQLARLVPSTVSTLVGTVDRTRKGTAMAAPLTAPRTSFNATITGRRSIAFVDVSLDEIKKIKNSTGSTVNDVVLTLCGGALRRYLEARDELPAASLLATVPVSVRETSNAPGANQVSALFTRLGTDIEDPLERLRFVTEGNSRAKDHNKAIPAAALQEWAELAAPKTFGVAVRLYSGLRLAERHPVVHNLVISNVPGPPVPIYFMGALVEAMYPLGPVFHGAGLNITVVSNNGRVHVGIIADAEAVPKPWDLAREFPEELDALRDSCENESVD
jgi:diacylglycerol O-acyltransferase